MLSPGLAIVLSVAMVPPPGWYAARLCHASAQQSRKTPLFQGIACWSLRRRRKRQRGLVRATWALARGVAEWW